MWEYCNLFEAAWRCYVAWSDSRVRKAAFGVWGLLLPQKLHLAREVCYYLKSCIWSVRSATTSKAAFGAWGLLLPQSCIWRVRFATTSKAAFGVWSLLLPQKLHIWRVRSATTSKAAFGAWGLLLPQKLHLVCEIYYYLNSCMWRVRSATCSTSKAACGMWGLLLVLPQKLHLACEVCWYYLKMCIIWGMNNNLHYKSIFSTVSTSEDRWAVGPASVRNHRNQVGRLPSAGSTALQGSEMAGTNVRQVSYKGPYRKTGTVEPHYNEVLGTMKLTLLYQVSHYIRVKKQRNIYKEVGPAELPCYKRVLLFPTSL